MGWGNRQQTNYTIDERLLTYEGSAVIAPWNHVYSLRHNWIVCILECIVYQDLICALPGLSLHIVHVTAAKDNNLVSICDAWVPVTSLYAFHGVELEILPLGLVLTRHQPGNFVVALMILATNQIAIIVHCTNSRIFTRRRRPPFAVYELYFSVERLSLLHSLYVGLQATSEAFRQLIPRDVIRWRRLELLRFVHIVKLIWLHYFYV